MCTERSLNLCRKYKLGFCKIILLIIDKIINFGVSYFPIIIFLEVNHRYDILILCLEGILKWFQTRRLNHLWLR